jgi:polysaccharide deacetylase 2 family uncharacterized protein YibQ
MKGSGQRYKIAVIVLSVIIIIQWLLLVRREPGRPPEITPAAVIGKIAIVLDDWGYNLNNTALLGRIKHPLTMSVLPNLAYSKTAARELHQKGFEVILHLPMEPQARQKVRLEKNTVMTSMSEAQIKKIISEDLSNVLYAAGVSNHMGSFATEDTGTMEAVFKELKKRRLYFLDSFATSDSACLDSAHKIRLAFAKRDIFLDNQADPEYIKGQIHKLKTRARLYGQAIGIGHDRKATLEVLIEMMPKLAREGYKFVFVSELVK